MIRLRSRLLALGMALGASSLAAQGGSIEPQCRVGTVSERSTQDACQKAIDLFQFMAPQLGAIIVGGNAVLGEHSTLRGPGHFSIGLRANALQSKLPRVDQRTPALSGATSSTYAMKTQVIGAPALDAAVGLFRGFPAAGSHVLGFDALVNVAYIPAVNGSEVSLEVPDGSLKFGFGGRLGIIQETFLTPGISVTYLRRELPTLNLLGRVGDDALDVRNVSVQSSAWRAVIGKNFSVFGLSFGAGQDHYETSATAQVTVTRASLQYTSAVVQSEQVMTRQNAFANLAINLAVLRLVGEVGRVRGGSIQTYNRFASADANDARDYASVGLRLAW